MSLIRVFIAIDLPAEVKSELAGLEAQLKKNSPAVVKWVDPNGIHITLKFLGETSDAGIDELLQAIQEAVQGVSPFQLEVRELGSFTASDRTQTIWVGVKGALDTLNQLQKNIEANTELLGYKREKRPYSPHLTLGRVRDTARPSESLRLGKLLSETTFSALHNVNVDAVNLMRSQLTPAGPIYTCIGQVKLK